MGIETDKRIRSLEEEVLALSKKNALLELKFDSLQAQFNLFKYEQELKSEVGQDTAKDKKVKTETFYNNENETDWNNDTEDYYQEYDEWEETNPWTNGEGGWPEQETETNDQGGDNEVTTQEISTPSCIIKDEVTKIKKKKKSKTKKGNENTMITRSQGEPEQNVTSHSINDKQTTEGQRRSKKRRITDSYTDTDSTTPMDKIDKSTPKSSSTEQPIQPQKKLKGGKRAQGAADEHEANNTGKTSKTKETEAVNRWLAQSEKTSTSQKRNSSGSKPEVESTLLKTGKPSTQWRSGLQNEESMSSGYAERNETQTSNTKKRRSRQHSEVQVQPSLESEKISKPKSVIDTHEYFAVKSKPERASSPHTNSLHFAVKSKPERAPSPHTNSLHEVKTGRCQTLTNLQKGMTSKPKKEKRQSANSKTPSGCLKESDERISHKTKMATGKNAKENPIELPGGPDFMKVIAKQLFSKLDKDKPCDIRSPKESLTPRKTSPLPGLKLQDKKLKDDQQCAQNDQDSSAETTQLAVPSISDEDDQTQNEMDFDLETPEEPCETSIVVGLMNDSILSEGIEVETTVSSEVTGQSSAVPETTEQFELEAPTTEPDLPEITVSPSDLDPLPLKPDEIIHTSEEAKRAAGTDLLECVLCSKFIGLNQAELDAHIESHAWEVKLSCTKCNASFETPEELSKHNYEHSKKFICPKCAAAFATLKGLKHHEKSHTKVEDDKSPKQTEITSYLMVATKEPLNPNKCIICSTQFKDAFELKTHVSTAHENENDENGYPCSTCNRKFGKKEVLIRHCIQLDHFSSFA